MTRVAVVLMNLGGPDSLEAVQPFLSNLFSDPAIIGLPGLLRLPLARLAARRRAGVARDNYARLGGRSPLLANTEAQACALETALGPGHRCFVAMRYWHPLSTETAREVAKWVPDEIVCLPLYPQFSTTTTASSLAAWRDAADAAGADLPDPHDPLLSLRAGVGRSDSRTCQTGAWRRLPATASIARLLLTAHGLPKRIVRAGDPYPDSGRARLRLRSLLRWLGPNSTGGSAIRAVSDRSNGSVRRPRRRSVGPARKGSR